MYLCLFQKVLADASMAMRSRQEEDQVSLVLRCPSRSPFLLLFVGSVFLCMHLLCPQRPDRCSDRFVVLGRAFCWIFRSRVGRLAAW